MYLMDDPLNRLYFSLHLVILSVNTTQNITFLGLLHSEPDFSHDLS